MRVAVFLCVSSTLLAGHTFARSKPQVTFESVCECRGNHGVARWAAKTDLSEPPPNMVDVKRVTPAEMFGWSGPGGDMPRGGGRIATELQWYAVTGRVTKLRVEDDGDLHIVLANVDNKSGEVVIEIPLGDRWCELRRMVFSWTDARFPFATARSPFRLIKNPTITAIGRAFYDTDHSGSNTRNNRRDYDQGLAVWEIHPVMRIAMATSAEIAPSSQIPQHAAAQPETPTPTAAARNSSRFTKPVTIAIPYGLTPLRPGMKLRVVSRTGDTVTVDYMGGSYRVPATSTDAR